MHPDGWMEVVQDKKNLIISIFLYPGGKTRFPEGGYPPDIQPPEESSGWIFRDVTDAKMTKNLFLSDIFRLFSNFQQNSHHMMFLMDIRPPEIGFCRQQRKNIYLSLSKYLSIYHHVALNWMTPFSVYKLKNLKFLPILVLVFWRFENEDNINS